MESAKSRVVQTQLSTWKALSFDSRISIAQVDHFAGNAKPAFVQTVVASV